MYGYGTAAGALTLLIAGAPANDDFANRQTIATGYMVAGAYSTMIVVRNLRESSIVQMLWSTDYAILVVLCCPLNSPSSPV